MLRAEAEASLDPLTSLVNRRELERLIRDRIARGTVFSILLFDINSLRVVNERFGQEAGDQVLRQFGARLVAKVRPRDIVGRWGGDDFAVIFDCASAGANARAQQIQWVSGRYHVSVNGQDWKPEVNAEVYLIEHREGEDENSFVARVNAFKLVSAPQPLDIPIGPRHIVPEGWRMM